MNPISTDQFAENRKHLFYEPYRIDVFLFKEERLIEIKELGDEDDKINMISMI